MENQGTLGMYVAYGAICLFLLLLALLLLRTVALFSTLLLMPVARVMRGVPFARRMVARLEERSERDAR